MIFKIDYNLNDKLENMNEQEFIDVCYKHFCSKYINQIKEKLGFKYSKLKIENPNKKVNKDDKIDILRFEMNMVNPTYHKNVKRVINKAIPNVPGTNKPKPKR